MRPSTRESWSEIEDLLSAVLSRVKPSREERLKVGKVASRVIANAKKAVHELGLRSSVEMHGSYAKDTWLSGEVDLDLFILFDLEYAIDEALSQGLRAAKLIASKLKAPWRECYAAHPYIEATVNGITVDLVPGFKVEKASEVRTPVDRTRLHTLYVLKNMPRSLRDDVRLLKRFMKGVGVYGAEVRVQGFSGYMCELLILAYGSFLEALRHVAKWKPYRVTIDIEGYFSEGKVPDKMVSPLVVVDPVDPGRNAAAAVSEESMYRIIAASRQFLVRPSMRFFFQEHTCPSVSELKAMISERGTYVFALRFPRPPYPEEIVWGQLRRSERGIRKFVERLGVEVYGVASWICDDKALLLVEVPVSQLPSVELHMGPPVGSPEEQRFILKYISLGVAGPFIRNGRWYVLRRRRLTRLVDILKERLSEVGLSTAVRESIERGLEVLEGPEVAEGCRDPKYRTFLLDWLRRREKWL